MILTGECIKVVSYLRPKAVIKDERKSFLKTIAIPI